jgi:hypothetical protein
MLFQLPLSGECVDVVQDRAGAQWIRRLTISVFPRVQIHGERFRSQEFGYANTRYVQERYRR